MRDNTTLMSGLGRWFLVALLFGLLVTVQAYENQESWLDGSLDEDHAMELLEADTDTPLTAMMELHTHTHQQQTNEHGNENENSVTGETEVEDQGQGETEAEVDTSVEEQATSEQDSEAETETDSEAESPAAMIEAAAPTPPPVPQAVAPPQPTEEEMRALYAAAVAHEQEASLMEVGSEAQWRNGPPRRHPHLHSVRAERERAQRKAREEAIYKENLRKLKVRREKWSMPATQQGLTKRVQQAQVHELQAHGAKRDADGFMTNEEAQVESLLQVNAQPLVSLHHVNDVHAKLTPDMLFGTGLSNEANRRRTAAGLEASQANHEQAPSFIQLPASSPVGREQPAEVSFVAKHEEQRPAYAGPATMALPPADVSHPTVLQSPIAHTPENPAPAQKVDEVAFVEGLPAEFMELDAATQVKILQLADAGVDIPDEPALATKKEESKPVAQAAAATKKEEAKPSPALVETEAAAETETETETEAESTSEESVDESELAAAGSALKALSELQKESHVPFAKLVHLLAKGSK